MRTVILFFVTLLFVAPVMAQGSQKPQAPAYEPGVWEKDMRGTFNNNRMDYTAKASETVLKDAEGKDRASIFSISYVKKGVTDPASRPITFLFNGGPGSASLWLHMGAFGPKRVVVPSDAKDDGAPPYPLVENDMSLLDVTDMVFIDPVGTGFSKVLGDTKKEDFYGINEDAKAIGDFIRVWLNQNGRWNSPKYIGGESYGTTRSAAVINELEGRFNDVAFNGILLISTILDFTAEAPEEGNELSPMIYLPTMAATAWYHGRIPGNPPLEAFVDEVRTFARTDYITALLQGDALPEAEHARVRAALAGYTGLSETYLDQTKLRLKPQRFMKQLLRDEGKTVGRLDSRYVGQDFDDAGDRPDNDPSFYAIDGAYTAAINHYLRSELGVDLESHYSVIGGLGGKWNWQLEGKFRGAYLNVAPYIGRAMRENSDLRVFNAAGYFDFATPFFGAEYSLSRNGIVPERVTYEYYTSGHMMYVHGPSLEKLNNDIRAFIKAGN